MNKHFGTGHCIVRLNCPHCQQQIEIVEDVVSLEEVSCPSCGSKVPNVYACETRVFQPSSRIGRFELLQCLGQGQFGVVWRARDTRLDRVVALKIPRQVDLDGATRKAFLREAQAAVAIDHPNVIRVLDVEEIDDQIVIVSEFVKGMDLRELLKTERLQYTEYAQIMAQVAEGVHAAHQKGVVHRDLKPSNILLDDQFKPIVTDFGMAKNLQADFTMTAAGVILGTPAYMSPEQARGESHLADHRTDVYALGVILYEMLTGRRPFMGSSELLLQQIQSMDPRAPRAIDRKIPQDLEVICLKAMEKDPARRYASALDLVIDLRRYLNGEAINAKPTPVTVKAWRRIRKNALVSSLLVLIAISTLWAIVASVQTLTLTSQHEGIQASNIQNQWTPIAWEHGSSSDHWQPAGEAGPLMVKSATTYACLLANQAPQENYLVELDTTVKEKLTRVGVIVGVFQTSQTPENYTCYALSIGPSFLSPEDGLRLIVERFEIAQNSAGFPAMVESFKVARISIDRLLRDEHQLAVRVQGGRIESISYCGADIPLVEALSDVRLVSPSRCGIVCLGHAIVNNFSIKQL